MIKQLAHLCIHAVDLDETARFYFEAIGLERGFEFFRDGQLFGYYINVGNHTFIEVFKGDPAEPGKINHLAIETDDIDAVIARIKAYGYDIGEKSFGADHSWQVWTADPDGVRIEFHEYTPESLQLNGGRCVVDW